MVAPRRRRRRLSLWEIERSRGGGGGGSWLGLARNGGSSSCATGDSAAPAGFAETVLVVGPGGGSGTDGALRLGRERGGGDCVEGPARGLM